MTREEYINKRNTLIAESEKLIDEGKFEEFNTKKTEVEDLDNKYTETAKARADLSALDDKTKINAGVVNAMATKDTNIKLDDNNSQDLYNSAFGKHLLDMTMTDEEKTVFNLKNEAAVSTTQATGDHAVVIPETYVKGIWSEMAENHPIIADTVKTFVEGDLVIVTGGIATGADWYDEETEVTDGAVTTAKITLKGYELAKAVTVSWLLKKMSIDEFIPFITGKISEVMGNALANAIINGKGVPGTGDTFLAQPRGIVTGLKAESQTPQIVEYSEEYDATVDDEDDTLQYATLTSAIAKIKSGYLSGSAIYAKNKTIWNDLATLMDNMGRPLFIPDVTSGGVGRMFGLTVKEEDAVSDNCVLIGNVGKGYAMNVNRNISIFVEDHVKKRETDYMGYAVIDGNIITEKAFAYIAMKVST